MLAAIHTYSTVIALVDARAEEVSGLKRDIGDILEQCRERSPDARVVIRLAIHEVEIWMLADPDSRKAAFGSDFGERRLPDDLEAVGDPKALWNEHVGQCAIPKGLKPELYADHQRSAAWMALRPAVVAYACPQGFAPFADAVRAVLR